jgi:hypothetical protein
VNDPSRRRVVVVSLLVTLLAMDLTIRSDRFLSLVPDHPIAVVHRKAQWLREQPAAEALIVGDSTAQRGIDVAAFERGSGMSARGAGMTAGTAIVERAMVADLPWQPRLIVYGMCEILLSDTFAAEPHELEVATLSESLALTDVGTALLGQAWTTFRRRSLLEPLADRPFAAPTAPPGLRFGGPSGTVTEDSLGSLPVDGPSFASLTPDERTSAAASAWSIWTQGKAMRRGARFAAADGLAESWQKQGVSVVYLQMPESSEMRDYFARRDPSDFASRAIDAIVALHGGRRLDCRTALPDDAFYDVHHVRAGPLRDRFSELLGGAVAHGSASCDLH